MLEPLRSRADLIVDTRNVRSRAG
ncbi:hypothetical protein ACLBR5_06230 [Escherichia coli]